MKYQVIYTNAALSLLLFSLVLPREIFFVSVYSFEKRLLKTSCLIMMKITKRTYCFLFLLANEVHCQISLLYSKF